MLERFQSPQETRSAEVSAPTKPQTPQTERPPVDMERLLDWACGDTTVARKIGADYLMQTMAKLVLLRNAISMRASSEVARLSHSCGGTSATCGMPTLASIFYELEQAGQECALDRADLLFKNIELEFERVRLFLASHDAENNHTLL